MSKVKTKEPYQVTSKKMVELRFQMRKISNKRTMEPSESDKTMTENTSSKPHKIFLPFSGKIKTLNSDCYPNMVY